MARTKGCDVTFEKSRLGWTAVKWKGTRSVNTMNYPRGFRMTAKERARARRILCQGDEEIRRPRGAR